MEIKLKESGSKGFFYIDENGIQSAVMSFSKAGDKLMIIDHTDVSDALRGKGAGKLLVKAGVEYARAHGVKILPLCPFAKSVFEREPLFRDVLDM